MITIPFLTGLTGLIGSLVLVTGAAWPEPRYGNHPASSVKNWLFTIGAIIMLLYAVLGYLDGGPVFFIFLETLVAIACVLMMLNTPDKIDTPIIALVGLGLVIWSLSLFEDYGTILFIGGLCILSLGYAFRTSSLRRSVALTLGSAFIAYFSYLEASWIFFWLNVFFALFSAVPLVKKLLKK